MCSGHFSMDRINTMNNLLLEIICSICLKHFTDPVTLDCGHNFCFSCIREFWEFLGVAMCPQCQNMGTQTGCKTNMVLDKVATLLKSLKDPSDVSACNQICEQHHAPLTLFCIHKKVFLCLQCLESTHSQAASVIAVEKAAEVHKVGRFLIWVIWVLEKKGAGRGWSLGSLWSDLGCDQTHRKKMVAEFQKLHQFLEQQENRLLAQSRAIKQEIVKKRDEHMVTIFKRISSINKAIEKLEEKCQLPPYNLLKVR
uniref:RING-type domain-containing protein n=1 Tax=Salvator merianae TaxID=96440 RepID=A0A8D0CGW0_SALMN